ncbi:MAG: MFS transporter [Actinobacteria bacterium]|nr:MAG: MFS transporter [Actinomycetota bacterium]
MRTARRSFLPIGTVAAYDALGYALVAPILPALRERAHASPLAASLIFAGVSIGMFAGFVIGGLVIIRTGPRNAAIGGVLLHLCGDLLFIVGHTAGVYEAARMAQGLGSGMVWMSSVFAVIVRWPEHPEQQLGKILTGFAAGSVIGPLVAALGGPVRPFVADACLAVVGLTAATFYPTGGGGSFGWRLHVLRSRRLAFALVMITLVALVISVLDGSYTLHFATKLSQTGLAVLITSSTIAYGVGALLPIASRSLRASRASAQVGAVCCAALLLGLTTFDSVAMWFVLIVLLGAALGVTEAGVLSISSSAAGGGLMTAQVVYAQAFAFGFLIGPPVATWLTTRFTLISSGVVVGLVLLLGAGSGFLAPMPDQPGPIR